MLFIIIKNMDLVKESTNLVIAKRFSPILHGVKILKLSISSDKYFEYFITFLVINYDLGW